MEDSWRQPAATEVDVWLGGRGIVVAASERAARAVAEDFHRARKAEGLTGWPAPAVHPWNEFVRNAWENLSRNDDRLVMNSAQEQALWAEIIASSRYGAALLESALQRMAKMAAQAHGLLCAYAPPLLKEGARPDWQQDAAAFSGWLEAFDRACTSGRLVNGARLPLELLALLKQDQTDRPAILLAGFDRLQPVQVMVLEAWGTWRKQEPGKTAERSYFYQTADEQSEIDGCALWCKEKLAANANARLLVVTQELPTRRGELERVFLRLAGSGGIGPGSEFSLGVPLGQIALVRAAYLVLRWLREPIEEQELDWLLGCGQTVTSPAETRALTGYMRALRRRGWERTQWTGEVFLRQRPGVPLPSAWAARMQQAMRRLESAAAGLRSPVAWADLVHELLETAGWPGERPLASEEFQALRRWQHVLDTCASLGFSGRSISWSDFLRNLGQVLGETLFSPEAQDASIMIAGPAESAGLAADAVWFMGVSEEAWPAASSLHPLLPAGVQRKFGMPHASAQLDWDVARTMTERLLTSAPEVVFSFARQVGGVEMRPSRLVLLHAGEPQPLPPLYAAPASAAPIAETFDDFSRIPLGVVPIAGGSAVLSAQSQCPFKAFASARLGAVVWKPAEAGLTAAQRGQLLHDVLHSVWSGAPPGIRSHKELAAKPDVRLFVDQHVQAILDEKVPASVRERMPRGYLVLEAERLTKIVVEWLEFERTRAAFTVAETEVKKESTIAGLALRLRLDRIDRLDDGSFLVIDYKTGNVDTKEWELPRPEDVQLPLYAGFALDRETQPLGGLVFAKVRAGKHEFAGRLWNATGALLPNGIEKKALAKDPLTLKDLDAWRSYIEQMARDFIDGRAEVNPREYPKTCEHCGLQTICRVAENAVQAEEDEEEVGDE